MSKGAFIVIEGSDGSGKTTHSNLLKEYLEAGGREVATYKFPQYEKPSSYFSVAYLNGQYGDPEAIGAYKPSLFYALDRFDASNAIRADLEAGKVVLCDRYVGSNMAHQGQKIANGEERSRYFDWIYNLEFKLLEIPEPDVNLVLLMPAEYAYEFMSSRKKRRYTSEQRDVHEANIHHLKRAVAAYKELTTHHSDAFTAIPCMSNDILQSIEDIQTEIRSVVDTKQAS